MKKYAIAMLLSIVACSAIVLDVNAMKYDEHLVHDYETVDFSTLSNEELNLLFAPIRDLIVMINTKYGVNIQPADANCDVWGRQNIIMTLTYYNFEEVEKIIRDAAHSLLINRLSEQLKDKAVFALMDGTIGQDYFDTLYRQIMDFTNEENLGDLLIFSEYVEHTIAISTLSPNGSINKDVEPHSVVRNRRIHQESGRLQSRIYIFLNVSIDEVNEGHRWAYLRYSNNPVGIYSHRFVAGLGLSNARVMTRWTGGPLGRINNLSYRVGFSFDRTFAGGGASYEVTHLFALPHPRSTGT